MQYKEIEVFENEIRIKGYPDGARVFKVPKEQYTTLYSYIAHKKDITCALEFFNYWSDKEVINKALFIAALTQFMKCFQPCGNRDNLKDTIFDENEEVKKGFISLKEIRNKFIIHDDSLFDQTYIGIVTLPSEKSIIDWVGMNLSANIFDDKYAEPLRNIIIFTLKKLDDLIDKEAETMKRDYEMIPWEEVEKMENIVHKIPSTLKEY